MLFCISAPVADPKHSSAERQKKIEALRAQAEQRGRQLREQLERKRREALEREQRGWQQQQPNRGEQQQQQQRYSKSYTTFNHSYIALSLCSNDHCSALENVLTYISFSLFIYSFR